MASTGAGTEHRMERYLLRAQYYANERASQTRLAVSRDLHGLSVLCPIGNRCSLHTHARRWPHIDDEHTPT